MPTTLTRRPATAADGDHGRRDPSTGSAGGLSWQRRRQLPLVALGVVLVVGSALAFAVLSSRGSAGRTVLVAAGPMPAGHVLAPADLTTVALRGSSVTNIPAAEEATVVGRPLAVPLLAGTLLTPADVGTTAGPAAGRAVVALALKPGQYPPMLGPGDNVQILPTATGTAGGTTTGAGEAGGGAASAAVSATVLAVDAQPEGSPVPVVASVQVDRSDAATVADWGAQGAATLVLLPAAGGAG